ncbi:copper resistance protein CopC [Paenibacillus shunpengii]|uniref:Copper resistance protein CopC n=1 Tax=Paenibacillus shunpengii TaxID=2054424 RepID=A0ABW5SSC4_9BACL
MKKVVLMLVLFLLLMPGAAFAHTHLESSLPADGEEITAELTEVQLTFEGPIEQLSTVEVVGENGDKVELASTEVEGNVLTGTAAAPFANGKYTANWKIIGEDGHEVTGSVAFTVNAPETAPEADAPPAEENNGDTPVSNEDQGTEEPAADTSTEAPAGEAAENTAETAQPETASGFNNTALWIGIVAAIVIAGVYVAMRKRGKK